MSSIFARSMRFLETDRLGHPALSLLIVAAVLVPWVAWFLVARLTVYEISQVGRLEVARLHRVGTPVAGRVASTHLTLGRVVRAGEMLVEIDGNRERIEIEEERKRLLAARQSLRATEATARLAADQHQRMVRLARRRLVPEADVMKTRAEAESRQAEVEALKMSIAAAEAAVARREEALALRHIRAPVDGRIGWLAFLDIGTVVREGDHLFSVVPDGSVRAMAEFVPSALGRLRPGLPARVRLDGFPWIQYGSIAATVESVGTEARDGRVRVELIIDRATSARVPLEHGLTGTVEVAVEQAAPAVLVVRAIGRWLTPANRPVQVTADR